MRIIESEIHVDQDALVSWMEVHDPRVLAHESFERDANGIHFSSTDGRNENRGIRDETSASFHGPIYALQLFLLEDVNRPRYAFWTMTNTKTAPKSNKRKNIRFRPDPGTYAAIDVDGSSKGAFKPTLVCLVTEESYKGCGLVSIIYEGLQSGDTCRVQVGAGPVMKAEVRWRTDLDAQVMRIGLMYLD